MNADRWDSVSECLNAWLSAGPAGRQDLRARLAKEDPEMLAEVEALAHASRSSAGFLETPALVLAAREVATEDPILGSGETLGPYRVVSLLARGGMGDVYRATDERLQRDVALKVLAHARTGDPRRVERFMHEARVTASLDHPNILRVYDVGRVKERAYLVAELLDGETIRPRVERGPLQPSEVVRIAIEIARGLDAAHAAGLVHRDLKPDNIFLTRSGPTKILDFGIAKLAQDENPRHSFSTLTGVVMGTAGYIAPEQIRGETVDRRADLFALGAVLFEMLTGERAFARDHVVESLHAILHDPPSTALSNRSDVPRGLRDIVTSLLNKLPEDRFQTAANVIDALEQVDMSELGAPAVLRGTRRPLWIAAVALVLLLIPAGVLLWPSRDQPRPAAVTPAPRSITLAIMPLRSIPAAKDDTLELGLADVLISRLGEIRDLRVLPLSATERMRGEEPVVAAQKLKADRVLVVTLQRESGRVRAVPRLMTSSGEAIWSTTVDTDASSIFSVQDIIVARVIEEIAPHVSAGARTRLARPGTRDNAAWEAYVRGRGYVLQPTRTDLTRAKESFEEAVKRDPGFADAWAGLGSAYKRMPIAGAASGAEALPKAKESADRALQLDPANPEAHSVLGTVAFWYEWDYRKAERLLRRALELQPSSADAQVFLAHVLANTGRSDEALEEIRRARALDPSWPVARAHEGHFLFMGRRYEEALQLLDETIKVEPRFWPAHTFRVLALLGLKRYGEAVRQCDTLAALRRGDGGEAVAPLSFKAYALARMGRKAEAETLLDEIRRQPPGRRGTAEALVLHALGRDDEALHRLEAAVKDRAQGVTYLGVYPWWDDLRASPRFRKLLAEVNLLEVSDRMRR